MNDGTGTTARDVTGGNHATAQGGVTRSGEHNGSVVLNGSTGHLTTATKVLDTGKSFSASARVKINSLDTCQTVVSQEGSATGAFFLQYAAAQRRWAFSLHAANTSDPAAWRAFSEDEPVANTWTHLAATYDANSRTARLCTCGPTDPRCTSS